MKISMGEATQELNYTTGRQTEGQWWFNPFEMKAPKAWEP
jgi:hypothetical protein